MSRDDHVVKFERAMVTKTKTKHYYITHNIATKVDSEGQPSWLYGQNLCGHFVRVVLAMNIEESDRAMAADGMTKALVSPSPR